LLLLVLGWWWDGGGGRKRERGVGGYRGIGREMRDESKGLWWERDDGQRCLAKTIRYCIDFNSLQRRFPPYLSI